MSGPRIERSPCRSIRLVGKRHATRAERPTTGDPAMRHVDFAALVLVSLPLAACENYTYAPVCTEANAALPPGIRGTYTLSVQHEDWSTETQELVIDFDGAGRLKTTNKASGAAESSYLCN